MAFRMNRVFKELKVLPVDLTIDFQLSRVEEDQESSREDKQVL
jgi:hypothetical protein